jgi:hypothetical protein
MPTPTRRELISRIVELVHATQTLVKATEENTRVSRGLRADIARMSRRTASRRAARPRRRGEPAAPAAPHLRVVAGGRPGAVAPARRRRCGGSRSARATHG